LFRLDAGQVYHSKVLDEFPWLEHGFGTRLSADWPDPSGLVTLRQVHSNKVLFARSEGQLGEADALITNVPGLTLAIRTADCLPILIADPRHRAIAAVHAGWRGTVLEILKETVEAMGERFGTHPDDLVVAIGPGIGACCYQVGPEVASRFTPFFPERPDLSGPAHVDLAETAARQLRRYGGSLRHIDTSGLCTKCMPDSLHSFRRDGEAAGRMLSGIRIRG
jgi:purine-nucleoside/S-methyl-5'-thioadenosine phosphorylase / adenosine deaminase